ncbi:hypothetical protein AB870_26180 (plasmid) [Pandoraea faecigallinarum]|uniref:Integrase catalytic domain-containing protein n=1 Tax=Pandoraea faecigallinarum TaxID=656179 RepID=A0A173H049_9BURK|nr:hypothetical protein AB870_26180 [Pandoraea faecigallinarum]
MSKGPTRTDVFDYVERFYNPTRRHSTLGYVSPIAFEKVQDGLLPELRHFPASRQGTFKGLGTDATQMGMTAGSIVKDFDVIEDVGARQITGFVDAFSHAFLFKTAEEGLGNRVDAPMSTASC